MAEPALPRATSTPLTGPTHLFLLCDEVADVAGRRGRRRAVLPPKPHLVLTQRAPVPIHARRVTTRARPQKKVRELNLNVKNLSFGNSPPRTGHPRVYRLGGGDHGGGRCLRGLARGRRRSSGSCGLDAALRHASACHWSQWAGEIFFRGFEQTESQKRVTGPSDIRIGIRIPYRRYCIRIRIRLALSTESTDERQATGSPTTTAHLRDLAGWRRAAAGAGSTHGVLASTRHLSPRHRQVTRRGVVFCR